MGSATKPHNMQERPVRVVGLRELISGEARPGNVIPFNLQVIDKVGFEPGPGLGLLLSHSNVTEFYPSQDAAGGITARILVMGYVHEGQRERVDGEAVLEKTRIPIMDETSMGILVSRAILVMVAMAGESQSYAARDIIYGDRVRAGDIVALRQSDDTYTLAMYLHGGQQAHVRNTFFTAITPFGSLAGKILLVPTDLASNSPEKVLQSSLDGAMARYRELLRS